MEKINIAEILKDCPRGMELDCTMFEDNCVEFDDIINDKFLPIRCRIKDSNGGYKYYNFTKYGCWIIDSKAKCVIFPKGKTTWEGFHRPFVDGDIIYNRLQKKICIYYLYEDEVPRIRYCRYNESNIQLQFEKLEYPIPIAVQDYRLATKEEKQKLFDAIKANGYKWNEETKTLERLIEPKFKIGDKITKIDGSRKGVIFYIDVDKYHVAVSNNIGIDVFFEDQDDWELIPNKFDINTLVPFESRVLVRSDKSAMWKPAIYGIYRDSLYWMIGGSAWTQCIPYEGNKHLLGKTDDCNDFYKSWE